MEDNQFKFKILLEKNGEQREVKLAGSIGEQLDLLRAHGPELEPAIRKFFGDRVTEAMEAWCDEEDVRILSEQEKLVSSGIGTLFKSPCSIHLLLGEEIRLAEGVKYCLKVDLSTVMGTSPVTWKLFKQGDDGSNKV